MGSSGDATLFQLIVVAACCLLDAVTSAKIQPDLSSPFFFVASPHGNHSWPPAHSLQCHLLFIAAQHSIDTMADKKYITLFNFLGHVYDFQYDDRRYQRVLIQEKSIDVHQGKLRAKTRAPSKNICSLPKPTLLPSFRNSHS